jgi:predicted Zn-dependent protease
VGATVFLTSGCGTVPVTGRSQLNFIPEGQEMALGLSSFDSLKKSTPISKDPAINAMVQKVGQRIAAVTGKEMPNAQWEFVVFDSKEANAFCLPGGKVGIYTGILPITKDEAGLATVIGHEVAHAVAKHGAERMSEGMIASGVGQYVGNWLGTKMGTEYIPAFNAAYGLGAQGFVLLPHSREQESEADRIGLTYMARAGYNPEASVQFWQRFMEYNKQNGGGKKSDFFSTHPADETRIKQLQGWLPEAQKQLKAQ